MWKNSDVNAYHLRIGQWVANILSPNPHPTQMHSLFPMGKTHK
jgi:hypothetical protein